MRRQWNSVLMCVAITACLAMPGNAGVWQDDFNGNTLDAGWEYIDPHAANVVEVKEGSFVVHLEGTHDIWGGFDSAPKLLRDAPEGDFAIESHYVIQPDASAGLDNTWTGIIVFDDTDSPSTDWLYVVRGGGSVVSFEYVEDGSGHGATTHSTQALEVWSRVEKTGNTYLCRYKLAEGDEWTDLGEYTPPSLNPLKVGLIVKSWANRSIVCSFDYFRMEGENVTSDKAYDPSPSNEATDVLRNQPLSWTTGEFAIEHDVYLGLSFDDVCAATRDNPLNVLVSQGQTASTYEPVGLAYGQTYYWRVDEVSAAPDSTIFKGNIWNFTVEPFAYVVPAASITATASSSKSASEGPGKVVDGSGLNAEDLHSMVVADMWRTQSGDTDPWILFTFAEPLKLHEMMVWNHNLEVELDMGLGIQEAMVEYSVDGTNWISLGAVEFAQATAQADYAANTTVAFDGAVAQYVKVTPISNWGGVLVQYGLSEVRFSYVPVRAYEPEPVDGAAGVSVESDLMWRAGREAASHEVYLGTDANDLALVDTVARNEYDPDVLDLDTQYFWRIVEVNEAEAFAAWQGDLWSFTTQQYRLIDDFESYNDSDNLIYETWIDGYVDKSSGSQVGYIEAPFAEGVTVHSGKQSMPFFYTNTAGVPYSEADLTFDTAQDWTDAGVTTLVLYFCGSLDNAAAQLYIKVNGVQVNYNGSTAQLKSPVWKQWDVDLASLGNAAKKVTTLTIGVSGEGSGLLFVDDIRLYRAAPSLPEPAVDPGTDDLAAHYTFENNLKDVTGHGYDGSSPWLLTYVEGPGDYGQAVTLNGEGDYVDLAVGSLVSTLKDCTIATFVNFANNGNAWQRVFDFGNSNTTGYMLLCPCSKTNGPIWFAITTSDGSGESIVTTDSRLPTGWHHVAVTIASDSMTVRIYVDGELAAEGSTATLPVDLGTTSQNWLGRSQYETDAYFQGSLDDFRIYRRTLSGAEIRYLVGDR